MNGTRQLLALVCRKSVNLKGEYMNNRLGRLAEKAVFEHFSKNGSNAVWVAKKNPTAPFDVHILNGKTITRLIEVKAFVEGRKHLWTQFKRPALKRKRAFAHKNAPDAEISTVCVLMRKNGSVFGMLQMDGLPSCDIIAFGKPL